MTRIVYYLAAPLLLVACGKTEKREGIVGFGPEAMYFASCETRTRSWLHEASFEASGWVKVEVELEQQPRCDLRTMPCKHQVAFVVADVNIREFGEYGHLGKYESEAILKQVHEVQPFSGQCEF